MSDIAKDVVRIMYPTPDPSDTEPQTCFFPRVCTVEEARKQESQALEEARSAKGQDFDPLLHELDVLCRRQKRTMAQIRALLAYAREFVTPEPYRLVVLARATQMSISGVRKAYGHEDRKRVALTVGRGDRKGTIYIMPSGTLIEVAPYPMGVGDVRGFTEASHEGHTDEFHCVDEPPDLIDLSCAD